MATVASQGHIWSCLVCVALTHDELQVWYLFVPRSPSSTDYLFESRPCISQGSFTAVSINLVGGDSFLRAREMRGTPSDALRGSCRTMKPPPLADHFA